MKRRKLTQQEWVAVWAIATPSLPKHPKTGTMRQYALYRQKVRDILADAYVHYRKLTLDLRNGHVWDNEGFDGDGQPILAIQTDPDGEWFFEDGYADLERTEIDDFVEAEGLGPDSVERER